MRLQFGDAAVIVIGRPGGEGEKPPAMSGGHGAMSSLGGAFSSPTSSVPRGVSGLHATRVRRRTMKRTIGLERSRSSFHCSQRRWALSSSGVCGGLGRTGSTIECTW